MDYTQNPGKYHESDSNKKWYEQRNKQLYKDKQAGMSNLELIMKYRVTPARIRYLLKHERSKNEY
jgi:Mor family transcriptional regulator